MDEFHIHRQPTRLGAFPSAEFWKPVQNLCTFDKPPTANSHISAPILRPKSDPAAPPLPPFLGRFFTKGDASPLMHFFRAVFRPFFSLVRIPKTTNASLFGKMRCFRGPFRALRRSAERPSLSHRNDVPASPAKAVQSRQSPRIPASQHAHMNASQIVTNFHMIQPTTTPRPARNPISCRRASSSRSSLLSPLSSLFFPPQIMTAPRVACVSIEEPTVLYFGKFFSFFGQDLHNGSVASLPYAFNRR